MPFIVYILYDMVRDRYYVGQTKDLADRLRRHLGKRERYTKSGNWELKRREEFSTRSAAVIREKEIKSWKSKIALRRLVAGP